MTAMMADGTAGPRVTEHHGFELPPELPHRHRPAFNGLGQYKVTHPITGKPGSFSRMTTVIKLLDDTSNLDKWKMRQVALGLNRKPDLATQLNEALEGAAENKVVDGLLGQADIAAGSAESREFGSAVHEWTEVVDAGVILPSQVPELYRAHVEAYLAALARHAVVPIPEYTERIVYCPLANAVGTLDRIYQGADGHLVLGDVKTSKSLSYSFLSYAAQLAGYHTASHMLSIDGTTWEPMPVTRNDFALLAHVPSDNAEGTSLVTYDLAVGTAALEAAALVRKMRSAARSSIPNQHAIPTPTAEQARQHAAVLALRLSRTVDEAVAVREEYADVWNDGLNTLGHAVVEAITNGNENAA